MAEISGSPERLNRFRLKEWTVLCIFGKGMRVRSSFFGKAVSRRKKTQFCRLFLKNNGKRLYYPDGMFRMNLT